MCDGQNAFFFFLNAIATSLLPFGAFLIVTSTALFFVCAHVRGERV